MFRGLSLINIDAKGRIAIPTRYRDALQEQCQGQLVMTVDTEERCLLLYPLPAWEDIQGKIEALPSFNAATRRIQRLLIGHATDIDIDSSGRILLPPPLRDYAKLDKKLVLIGQGKKFEVWDEALWEEKRDQYIEEPGDPIDLPDIMQSLSL